MLSDHEQRVLAELEGSLVGSREPGSGAPAAARSFRDISPTGWGGVVLIASLGAFLLVAGAPVGGAALLLAAGLVGLSWSCWPLLADEPGPVGRATDGRRGRGRASADQASRRTGGDR